MYHNQHILYYVETAVDQVLIWFFWSLFFKLLTQIMYRFERCAFTNDLQMHLQAGKNLSGSSCPAFWSKEGWVVEVCNDSLCLLYDWPSQTVWLNSLESLIQEYHLEKFPIQAFLPGNKQTNKQETLLSKYLVHFQNWMFDCLFIYFLLFILAALTAELVRSIWIKIAIEANCTVWILDFRSTFTIWL